MDSNGILINTYIDIGYTGLSDTVPDWFWNLSTTAEYVILSGNQLKGKVPDLSSLLNLSYLVLSNNSFDGPLPRFSANMKYLALEENLFSGHISHICESMVGGSSLYFLFLYGNNFSGELPDCWMYGQILMYLILGDNHFHGKIPDSIGHLPALFYLGLEMNRFSGSIPAWIGESFPNLAYLNFNSNNFSGTIPLQLCQLKYLKFLNISFNHISGTIPLCINKIMGMARADYDPYTAQEDKYRTLQSGCGIDLSSNKLSGEIPNEVMSLIGLVYLNISNNHLTGAIPHNIGSMELLGQLDISRNKLSCSIPTSISDLTSLEYLDVSRNNLSGKIPSSMQKFGKASFMGNPNLCGPPTTNDCLLSNMIYEDAVCRGEGKNKENESSQDDNDDGLDKTSFYISMAVGFITSYCGFWSALLFNSSWRNAYYRFLGDLCDKIYVMVVVNMNRLRMIILLC